MNYIAIFATSNREFFETLQNKERGKKTRSFLSRSPYQIYILLFISNQSITFTPITFMRRFAISVPLKTLV